MCGAAVAALVVLGLLVDRLLEALVVARGPQVGRRAVVLVAAGRLVARFVTGPGSMPGTRCSTATAR
jgi:hypothetical protein